MTKRTWLLIDVSYFAWRSFYAIPGLAWEGVKTTVVYGVLREVEQLQDLLNTRNVVFAFDVGKGLRKKAFPGYKAKRKDYDEMDHDEIVARAEMYEQIKRLRTKYLPAIGYRNIWWADGYEADDLIAAGCQNLPEGDDAVIVSRDADFYQLLGPRVSIWNSSKKRMVDADWLRGEFGIGPGQWADVKAIAGCKSDEVPGVEGVGEITAAKFLAGTLKDTTKKYQAIVRNNAIWERNLPLVRLPYEGCPVPEFREDETTSAKWRRVAERLGITTLGGLV